MNIKELLDQKRVEVSDRTYDNQRKNAELDTADELEEKVKTLSHRASDLKSTSHYHEAELNELNAAIDVLTAAAMELDRQLGNIGDRIVEGEELIGIDDESEHPWADDCTITDSIACHDATLARLNHNVKYLIDLEDDETRQKRLGRIENDIVIISDDINKLKTLFKLADVKAELTRAADRTDAKLAIFEEGMNQKFTRLQEQINVHPSTEIVDAQKKLADRHLLYVERVDRRLDDMQAELNRKLAA